ncbi:MAG: amidohydrolase family protein [Nitriliruptorales bacterium]|nr:amidohydrolase family protein [Nitriliruptorales bacterium]
MPTRINADVLIPGRGDPVRDGVVVMEDGSITYAGPASDAPDTPEADSVDAAAVMPGMWECHGHFLGSRIADLRQSILEPAAARGARMAKDAEAAIRAGFTSVREVGGDGVFLAQAIEDGTVTGPTIYGAHAILSTTGGHGDMHGMPLDWVHSLTERGGYLRLCDGVDECLKAVREQLRVNAKVIKFCASGGVMSELDDPIHQQFSLDEMRAIVEEAARAERGVAAHCHGKPGIMAALAAGVTTIEHGTFLDEEAAEAMVEADAILVTTRYIVERLLSVGEDLGVPSYAMDKARAIGAQHEKAMRIAYEAGVKMAVGTDMFVSGRDLPVAWGQNAHELELLVEIGMSPLEAIEAATARGPETLGPQAPRSGQLAEGYDADVLTIASDPSQDVSVLTDVDNITGVWKGGVRVH